MNWSIRLLLSVALLATRCADPPAPDFREHAPQVEFRLALELIPETKIWEAAHLFKEALEQASPADGIEAGEIKVNFYDQGSIGTERQLLEACYFGVVEVVQVNTSVVSTIEPTYAILNLPYLFEDEAHHQAVLQGETGQEMLDMLESHRLQGLGFYSAGFRNIFYKYSTDQPCPDTPAEFRGLKIRVMESPIMISSINAMGASATPIPFSELYQSLKTGVVDGADNNAKVFVSYDYQDTGCNCFTLTEHSTDQHVLVANAQWLNSLPPRYTKRIKEAARQITATYDSVWKATTESALKEMQQNHVRVNRLADKQSFVQSVRPVYPQFFDLYPKVSRSLYDRIKNQPTSHDTF